MQLLDSLPCAVLVTDRSGRVLAANAELAVLGGWRQDEVPGRQFEELLPPPGRIFLQTHVWPMLLRDGEVHEILLPLLNVEQQRLPVLLNARLGDWDEAPAVYWTLFVARERHRFEAELVAARNRAEASALELAEGQRFVRTVTDAIPGLVSYWDHGLRCRFANVAHQDWLGQAPERLIDQTLPELLGPERFATIAPHVRAVLAGEARQFEQDGRMADGSAVSVWTHYIPDLVDGTVAGFVVLVTDVSRLKAVDAELRTEIGHREQALARLQDSHLALQAAQQQLRHLYEATPALLHSIDAQGRLLHVSDAWLNRLGYRREEVVGRSSTDFLSPESQRHAREVVLPAFFASGRCDDVAYQMVSASGELVDVLLSAILERNADGQPLRSLALVKDVTLRRRAERELAREHERLRNLIDSTHAGTWEYNVQTGEVVVNDRWAAILGRSLGELGPVTIDLRTDMAHPDELARTRHLLREHFAGRSEAYVAEVRLRHADGHWVWVEDRGRLISRTVDGKPEWMFGIHIDISERKRSEEALRRGERLLHRTGEVAGVGGWELDLRTGAPLWSRQTCRIHGLPEDHQPLRSEALRYYPPEALPLIKAAIGTAIDTGEGWDLELPFVRADQRRIWVRVVGHVDQEEGRAVRLVGALQDITAQVQQRHALEQANRRMALANESGNIGVWEYDLASGQLHLDAGMERLYGLSDHAHDADLEALLFRLVHVDDQLALRTALRDAVIRQRDLDTEFRIVRPDGSVHHLRATAHAPQDTQGRTVSLVGVSWDVTALRRLSAQLAEQHELLHVTLQSIGDAVITTDSAGRITWLNPVAERMTGWPLAEAQGLPIGQVFRIVNETTRHPVDDPTAECLAQGKVVGLANHTVLLSRDGAEYGIEDSAAPIRSPRGEVLGAVLVFHDVSEQRRLSGEMTYRATHDMLTGLVNRSEFDTRLQRLLDKARSDGSAHALLYIDLDQFKLVNDACGHAVGDQLLQQVGRLLQDAVRTRDTLARLGGDEFAVLLEHCDGTQAMRIAQKLCDRMDDYRFVHEERRFRIGASIGLVPVDKRWANTAAIQKAADTSCYAAKEAGRNRVHAWFDTDAAMQARQFEMQWTSRIEQALDVGGFVLFAQRIQPLRAAARGVRAEVLLRLRNHDGSLTMPGAFLPAAERFHLVSRVDRWVLAAVATWMRALPSLNAIELLSVNLSGQSVGDKAFQAWAIEQLRQLGPEVCRRLCLEITETAAVTNLAEAASFIAQVRGRGVRVALDDFGAGASSFGYLKGLAVDCLKIDGQFVTNLVGDPLDDAAVRCFTDVARVVGVETTAEFVDHPDVLARLREIGVDHAQGFMIHRPEAIDQLLEVVWDHPWQHGLVAGGAAPAAQRVRM